MLAIRNFCVYNPVWASELLVNVVTGGGPQEAGFNEQDSRKHETKFLHHSSISQCELLRKVGRPADGGSCQNRHLPFALMSGAPAMQDVLFYPSCPLPFNPRA